MKVIKIIITVVYYPVFLAAGWVQASVLLMFAQTTEYWPMFPVLLPTNLHLFMHTWSLYLYLLFGIGSLLLAYTIDKRINMIGEHPQDNTLIDDIKS
jgi:hypothetical protein